MKLVFGQPVLAGGEPFGELADVVLGVDQRTVERLVVEPHRARTAARLVPFDLVVADADHLELRLAVGAAGHLPTSPWPSSACELRARAAVTAADGRLVGRLSGCTVDGGQLCSLQVQPAGAPPHQPLDIPAADIAAVGRWGIALRLAEGRGGRGDPSPSSGFAGDAASAHPDRRARLVAVRVLVVEDEVRQAAALKRGLEAEGFTVDVTGDGTDGLWLATEEPYDAIVLDVMLPGMNGYRVCAELRARSVWTPVLILTAKDGELDEAEALDTGADDFLSKPFSYIVLVARLRALIRRGAPERPVDLQVGDIVLDVSARRCRRAGEPVELTPRECAVLEHLMRHHDEVVPKTDILDHVWDAHFDGSDNIVEVHVSALRRKLGSHAIETVRGAGYRMSIRAR